MTTIHIPYHNFNHRSEAATGLARLMASARRRGVDPWTLADMQMRLDELDAIQSDPRGLAPSLSVRGR